MPILHWLTRDADLRRAAQVPYRLLEEVPGLSHGDPGAGNMLIQGDNLDALKALLPYYAGKVKCIYIDPPYNTRSAFEHYDDNLEHAQWLAMMYPRLELLHRLLSQSGLIWMQLDDNETHYAKVIMDEIFGRYNFLADVIWQKSYAVRSNAEHFSTSTEHVLVYAKDFKLGKIEMLGRSEEQLARFINLDDDKRGSWQSITFTISLTSGARGKQYAKTGKSANLYEVISPSGVRFNPPKGRCWARSESDFKKLNEDGRIWWGAEDDRVPRLKMFLSETDDGITPTTLWADGERYGFNQDGIRQVRALGSDFSSAKPEQLISKVIASSSKVGDLVLDSFLGSGTTAAVAHKMGRRYIGVEMGGQAQTHCAPRLRKVIEGEQGGISEAVKWQDGGGFRFFRLGDPVFDEAGHIAPGVRFAALAAHLWFVETGSALAGLAASPLLGVHDGTAIYLLYNGILGDKRPGGGNVLTAKVLDALPAHPGPRLVFGEACRLGTDRLRREDVEFRQIPYDITTR